MRRNLVGLVLLSGSVAALAACSGGEGTGTSRDGVTSDMQMAPTFTESIHVDTIDPSDTTASTSAAECAPDAEAPPVETTPDAGTSCTACTADAATSPPAADAGSSCVSCGCTLTQGYWKNHASKWPVVTLTVGGVTYGQSELLTLFGTPPSGDASLILAHQLFAAMLNRASGAGATPTVVQAIADANAWMAAHADADGRLPFGVSSSSAAGSAATSLSTELDAYNNGNGGPAHCE